jgi:cadmium resistance protein CadD (predicted permease)
VFGTGTVLVAGRGEKSVVAACRGVRMIVTISIGVVMPLALVIVPRPLVVGMPGTILIALAIRPVLRAKCDGTDAQRECKEAKRQRFEKVSSHVISPGEWLYLGA